jgi:hypothetical protein
MRQYTPPTARPRSRPARSTCSSTHMAPKPETSRSSLWPPAACTSQAHRAQAARTHDRRTLLRAFRSKGPHCRN